MKADQYVTVSREGVHESEINRSRFLCSLAPAATEQEAQEFVARIRKEHPTATHNCFAYVIGADASVQKASDDGEPGGTAGVPMLQMLMRRDIRYAVAVVTRYYGGVKLGAAWADPGLRGSRRRGPRRARHRHPAPVPAGHRHRRPPARFYKMQNDLRSTGRLVLDVRYGEAVSIEIGLPEADAPAFRAWLADISAGTAGFELGGEAYGEA